ncbi:hypothetical protein [Streptomyces longwoodensis]|uniref:hypothetical protein n=1 Tax=Streptomyces longwoodensis TaxID=68231 RepID=UPI0037BDD8F3
MQGWKRNAVVIGCLMLILAMGATWVLVDLNTAGQAASVIGCVIGIVGLLFTLLSARGSADTVSRAVRTGRATTTGGGRANTGIVSAGGGQAEDTGEATSHGGTANTGVTDGF